MRQNGFSGSFKRLMQEHPDVSDLIRRLYIQKPKMSIRAIHRQMVDALLIKGLGLEDYPFTTQECGRKPLSRYLKELVVHDYLSSLETIDVRSPIVPHVPLSSELVVDRTVRGDIAQYRRPHVNFMVNEYYGDILSRKPKLIGQTIKLAINSEDIRIVSVYSCKDQFIDNLHSKKLIARRYPITLDDQRNFLKERLQFRETVSIPDKLLNMALASLTRKLKGKTNDR